MGCSNEKPDDRPWPAPGLENPYQFRTGSIRLPFGYLGLLEQRTGSVWALELELPPVSIVALDHETLDCAGLTATDVSVLTALSYQLGAEGIAGACVPAVLDDGQRMVAILNPNNEAILFGFGRDRHGYYVFDWDGRALVEACSSIDEILSVFK